MFLIYPVSLLRGKLKKKKKSCLTLVPGWAKGFDTKCSFVPETLGAGAKQPARTPQTLPLGEDRGTQKRAHRTQPLKMFLPTTRKPAVLPLQRSLGFWPGSGAGVGGRAEGPRRAPSSRGPRAVCCAWGAGRADRDPRFRGGREQQCGRRAKSGRQRAGAPGQSRGGVLSDGGGGDGSSGLGGS